MFKDWLETLKEIHRYPWKRVSGGVFIFVSLAYVVLAFAIIASKGFVPLLDHVNLAFHESGHLFFGFMGSTMHVLGGTLGELIVPIAVGCSFWSRRDTLGVSVAGMWFFENFFYIASYMADARAQRLPLVGGGDHDWANLFIWWDLILYDTKIAAATRVLGWIGMLLVWGWLFLRWKNPQVPEKEWDESS